MRQHRRELKHAIVLCLLSGAAIAHAAISVTLAPSTASTVPLGTLIHWSTSVNDTGAGPVWYRFRSRQVNGLLHMIVDYGPNDSLDWTEMNAEGSYQVELSVRDTSTGETATTTATIHMTTRLRDAHTPVISTTNHPLVFLYSAPGCRTGGRMSVQFKAPDGTTMSTPYQACHERQSMNFYLAGMRAQTAYTVQHTLDTGSGTVQGPVLTITTPAISITTAAYNVFDTPPSGAPNGILLQCPLEVPTAATDFNGNVLWYYLGQISFVTRAQTGGYFLGVYEDSNADPSHEYFRKFDLAGTTIAETNAARINEQLMAMGRQPIDAFHHEARVIGGDKYLLLADTERILTGVQGPGPVDIIGDQILVLDSELQVIWVWDAFDHLDTSRMAVLGETCPSGAGCAPYHLAATANDWLHGNSLQLTPDGQILYSSRHQDWLFKINYNSGLGDGRVIWRLGLGGDFQIISSDPYPWFSHQHDANMEASAAGPTAIVFDDGNTRVTTYPGQNSRGQVFLLDEQNLTATLTLNVDLGAMAFALGAAQQLPDGSYHFDVGWITNDTIGGANSSRSVEVDKSGNVLYGMAITTPEYRTFRMPDLYTPQDQ